MTYPFCILDVFAEAPLEGNQLAVVREAGDLSTAQMQAVALETNFSETTFVTGRSADGAFSVRIFTPSEELPFAGHPTLGTAWLLREAADDAEVVLDLKAGRVPVRFERDGLGWLTPPPVEMSAPHGFRELAAGALGITPADLDDLPVLSATVGPDFLLVPIRSRSVLQKAQPDVEAWDQLLEAGAARSLLPFSLDGDDTDIEARMFFRPGAVREDPATGSANATLATYLRDLTNRRGVLTVTQGRVMGRPSRLYLDLGEQIRVGGRVHQVVAGELALAAAEG